MIELKHDWDCATQGDGNNLIPLQLRWIEPGEFLMGSPVGDLERNPDEAQYPARISNGFWMGAYPVTQAQYQFVTGNNPSHFAGNPNRPVECVSWHDAINYCEKLTEALQSIILAGYRFSLPTETQWEYCCRAGASTAYCCGNSSDCLDQVAWYALNSGGETHPVGTKSPNAWRLYDMQGNVCEWCLDQYGPYPATNCTDWIGRHPHTPVVFRSGSWGAKDLRMFRSAHRGYCDSQIKRAWFGFRVCLHSLAK